MSIPWWVTMTIAALILIPIIGAGIYFTVRDLLDSYREDEHPFILKDKEDDE